MALKPYWENGHYHGLIHTAAAKTWPDANTEATGSISSNLGLVYGYLAHPNDSNEDSFIRNYGNDGNAITVSEYLCENETAAQRKVRDHRERRTH